MKHTTRVSKNRKFGPLLKLAAEIAIKSDGRPCSSKTVQLVATGFVTSARVEKALDRAKGHPGYRRWLVRQLELAKKASDDARRKLSELERQLSEAENKAA